MSVLSRYVLRGMRKNRVSVILIVLSLALSAALLYLNLNVQNDLLAVAEKLNGDGFGGYDLCLTDLESDTEFPQGDGSRILPIRYGGEEKITHNGGDLTLSVIGSDWVAAEEAELVELDEGKLPTAPFEIGISRRKAKTYGICLGDVLHVGGSEYAGKYTVCGFFSSLGIFQNARDDYVEILVGQDERIPVNAVLVDAPDGESTDAYALRLEDRHPSWTVEILYARTSIARQSTDVKRILYLIVALCAVMGSYVIYAVSSMMTKERLPDVGTFRSIGADRRTMRRMLLAEHGLYGLCGGLIGIGIGEVLRVLLKNLYYKAQGADYVFHPLYALICLLFTLGMEAAITLILTHSSEKKSIKDVILRTEAVPSPPNPAAALAGALSLAGAVVLRLTNRRYLFAPNVAALALVLIGFSLVIPYAMRLFSTPLVRLSAGRGKGSLFLAAKNLQTERISHTSVILTAMATSLALAVFLSTSSVKLFYDRYLNNFPYDVYIKNCEEDFEDYSSISSILGVKEISAEYWDNRRVKLNDMQTRVGMTMPGGYVNGIEADDALLAGFTPGRAVFDELLAVRIGVGIGDTVRVQNDFTGFSTETLGIEGETYSFTVAGLCDASVFDSDRTTIILCPEDYAKYVETCPAVIGVWACDPDAAEDLLSLLAAEIWDATRENVRIYTRTDYLSDEYDNIRSALSIFGIIPLIAIGTAIFGLINNQTVAYLRKRREYAVIRSVAAGKRQLHRSAFYEMFLIFLFGEAFGLGMSLWITRIVRDVLFTLVSYVAIRVDLPVIGILLACALALLCALSFIPRRVIEKTNVVEVIKYE